jgi:site-specific recombinase
MFKQFEPFLERWRSSKNRKHDLDILIERANPNAEVYDRVVWLIDLLQWIRYSRNYRDQDDIRATKIPGARIKFFLQFLERNADLKLRVAQTLRSVVRDMSSSELFVEVGLPREQGFWAEFRERFLRKILPEAAVTSGMAHLFTALFASPTDSAWLFALDAEVFRRLIELVKFQSEADLVHWNTLQSDMEQGLLVLAVDIQAAGLSSPIRRRIGVKNVAELPFTFLSRDIESFLNAADGPTRREIAGAIDRRVLACRSAMAAIYKHLDEFGVSSDVVYTLDTLNAKIRRLEELVLFLSYEASDSDSIQHFMIRLIEENQERQSLSALLMHNSKMLAKKIVDRSAQTGEHYIARTDTEYKNAFTSAAGGGLVTAFTVYIKMMLSPLRLSPFFQGFFYSLNYSLSFMVIHFAGFTLATKQPAMTGPALASRMNNIEDENDFKKLIDEIVALIQTQSIGIIGNVGVVIPAVIFVEVMVEILFHRHFLLADKAEYVFNSTSILGMSPFFAAFTGVLLWLSSLFSGWVDNWFALHSLDTNIRYNRRLIYIFGSERCERWAAFLRRNIASFASNISLGFFLGLTPSVLQFFGLNIEVRHITLQSGAFAAGVMYFGLQSFKMSSFYLAVLGLMSISALNVGVSFTLAFIVAVRSREIQASQRKAIYSALWQRFKSNPWRFFFRRLAPKR